MGDPVIKSVIKWWFRLFSAGCVSLLLGVVMFFRFSINAGTMPSTAYVYAGIIGALILLGLVWVRSMTMDAPDRIEGLLRRMGLYRDN
jgi:hypothetical protein